MYRFEQLLNFLIDIEELTKLNVVLVKVHRLQKTLRFSSSRLSDAVVIGNSLTFNFEHFSATQKQNKVLMVKHWKSVSTKTLSTNLK